MAALSTREYRLRKKTRNKERSKWAAPGFVQAERHAEKKARRQQGRRVVESQLAEMETAAYLEAREAVEAHRAAQIAEQDRQLEAFLAEEQRYQAEVLPSLCPECHYDYWNGSYYKWKERQVESGLMDAVPCECGHGYHLREPAPQGAPSVAAV